MSKTSAVPHNILDAFGRDAQSSHHPKLTRAISSNALSSSPTRHHQAELLKLESRLFQYESQIDALKKNLNLAESTLKETRKALQRSEADVIELEKAQTQIRGLHGIQTKLAELTEEHRRSKERRDKEIARLSGLLKIGQQERERWTLSGNLGRDAFDRLNLHTSHYIPALLAELKSTQQTLFLEKQSRKIEWVRIRKKWQDRLVQVDEMVSLINELESREDDMLEEAEVVLEVESIARHEAEEFGRMLLAERQRLNDEFEELKGLNYIENQLCQGAIDEAQQVLQAEKHRIKIEDCSMAVEGLDSSLLEMVESYESLAKVCRSTRTSLDKAEDQLNVKDCKIAQLSDELSTAEFKLTKLESCAAEWDYERQQLVIRASEAIEKEMETKRKCKAEVNVSRQAEAAIKAELDQLQQVQVRLKEVEKEKSELEKLNNQLSRQATLDAEEIDKLASINAELVSHHNPAQRLKVLDRMRREGKEEKKNMMKLQNELWDTHAQVEKLKQELQAYRAVSPIGVIPVLQTKPSIVIPKSPSQQLVGLSRVSRPALSEVTIHRQTQKSQTLSGPSQHPKLAILESLDPVRNNNNAHRLKRGALMVNQQEGTSFDEIVGHEGQQAELSLGAIKMQGQMTLDELR